MLTSNDRLFCALAAAPDDRPAKRMAGHLVRDPLAQNAPFASPTPSPHDSTREAPWSQPETMRVSRCAVSLLLCSWPPKPHAALNLSTFCCLVCNSFGEDITVPSSAITARRHQPAIYGRAPYGRARSMRAPVARPRSSLSTDPSASNAIAKRILETLGEISKPFQVHCHVCATCIIHRLFLV